MLGVLEQMEYKDRQRKLVVHLEKRWLRKYLLALCSYLINGYRQDGARLCLGVHSERQGAVNANCSKMNPIR